jgi:uncharacterized membrane protein
MITGQLALLFAALFAGAALYVSVAEHPARMTLADSPLLTEWQPSYKRGAAMQAPLALLGFLTGAWAYFQSGNWQWLLGAVLIVSAWPYTMIVIKPTNDRLLATNPNNADAASRELLKKWGRLHAVRTALGLAATAVFVWASLDL